MAKTVIDELIVTLGLDASKFTAGQKQAAQALLNTQHTVENSVGAMGSALAGFAGKLTAFFLGFEGLRGVIDLVKDTAFEMKQLAITADLMGTHFREARVLQELSELAGGGKGSNMFGDWLMGFRMQLSSMGLGKIPQQFLPALIGVNPFELAKMPADQVPGFLSKRIHEYAPFLQMMMPGARTPHMAEQQFAQLLGLPAPGAAELANQQQLAKDENKAKKDNAGVTDKMGEAARQTANDLTSLRYQAENLAAQGFTVLDSAAQLLIDAFGDLSKIIDGITNSWFGKLFVASPYDSLLQQQHSITSQNEATGVQFAKAFWQDLQAFFTGEGKMVPLPALPRPPSGVYHPTAVTGSLIGGGGQNTHLTIGSMTVNTKATDAAGVAAGMHAAIRRKFDVTQADSGIVQ
jgi:hypothetical protein